MVSPTRNVISFDRYISKSGQTTTAESWQFFIRDIRLLQQQTVAALDDIASHQADIQAWKEARDHSSPPSFALPSANRMEEILHALRTMPYPPEYTAWIDTARTLARQSASEINRCAELFRQLSKPATHTRTYPQNLVNVAYRMFTQGLKHADELNTHLLNQIQSQHSLKSHERQCYVSSRLMLCLSRREQQAKSQENQVAEEQVDTTPVAYPEIIDFETERTRHMAVQPNIACAEGMRTLEISKGVEDLLYESTELQRKLSNLLLKCPSMETEEDRLDVINQLQRDKIKKAIRRRDKKQSDVLNIVRACTNHEGGITELIEAINFFEEDSKPMNAVKGFLQDLEKQVSKPEKPLEIHKPPDTNGTEDSIDHNVQALVQRVKQEIDYLKKVNSSASLVPSLASEELQKLESKTGFFASLWDLLDSVSQQQPEHTKWVDTARRLTREVDKELNQCWQAVNQVSKLSYLRISEDQLGEIEKLSDRALRKTEALLSHCQRFGDSSENIRAIC